jgi:GNAT superfamily N-acetyltransferase
MDSPVRIRAAVADDIGTLLPMIEDYWRFEAIEGFDGGRIARLLGRVLADESLGRAWLAFVDGAPAGYLLAVFVFSLEHQGVTAEIDEFFVLPAHRGRRVGAQLLAAAESDFRSRGCTNASLQIGRDNAAARAFYHGRGYRDRAGFSLVDKML